MEEYDKQCKKGFICLENYAFYDAQTCFDRAKVIGDEPSEAYIGLMLVELRCINIEEAINESPKEVLASTNFKLALSFAVDNEKTREHLNSIKENCLNKIREMKYLYYAGKVDQGGIFELKDCLMFFKENRGYLESEKYYQKAYQKALELEYDKKIDNIFVRGLTAVRRPMIEDFFFNNHKDYLLIVEKLLDAKKAIKAIPYFKSDFTLKEAENINSSVEKAVFKYFSQFLALEANNVANINLLKKLFSDLAIIEPNNSLLLKSLNDIEGLLSTKAEASKKKRKWW